MRGLIRSITNNLIDYDEKYMKIKFDSDDLPVNITIEFHNATIVVRSVFYTINRYQPQIFLAECLYKLQTKKRKTVITNINEKKAIC